MSVLSGQNAGVNGDGINTPDKIKHDELLDFNEIKDINNSTQKLEEVGTSSVSNSSAESIARQIYSESNSKESEQDFVKRALALAISRIRDVRTPVEINEYLKRPFAVGGLGLAGEELESAIKKIQEAHARYHIQTQNPIVKPIAQSPQISDSPQKPIEQAQKATQEIIQQPLQNKITQKSPSNTTNSQKKLDDLINQESTGDISIESILKSKPKKPTSTPSPYTVQQNYFNRSPVPQGKVRIDDIKPTHKSPQIQDTTKEKSQSQPQSRTTGLSDELSAISLSDYRALGNAQQAEQYILKKILLLGQNSLEHKLKGIANFRNSSLVNQYINIGDASLSKDKNLANILSDSNINPENMTQDEFFAISTLNSKLK
jgi:hypothetical protein